MFLNLNPGAVGIAPTSLEMYVALAARHGFGGVDLLPAFLASAEAADQARERLEAHRLRWGLFPLPCDCLKVDDAQFEAGLAALARILPLVQRAGCRRAYNHIWPGDDTRPYQENFDWHVSRITRLARLLDEHGVTLGLEFIGPRTLRETFRHPFIHTLAETIELMEAIEPQVGVVIDCFHWYTSGGTVAELRDLLPGRLVVNVHANDAFPGRSRDEQLDMERAMPLASGLVDAPGVLQVLQGLDYDGPVIAEPFRPTVGQFRELPADDVAAQVAANLRTVFTKAGVEC